MEREEGHEREKNERTPLPYCPLSYSPANIFIPIKTTLFLLELKNI